MGRQLDWLSSRAPECVMTRPFLNRLRNTGGFPRGSTVRVIVFQRFTGVMSAVAFDDIAIRDVGHVVIFDDTARVSVVRVTVFRRCTGATFL